MNECLGDRVGRGEWTMLFGASVEGNCNCCGVWRDIDGGEFCITVAGIGDVSMTGRGNLWDCGDTERCREDKRR